MGNSTEGFPADLQKELPDGVRKKTGKRRKILIALLAVAAVALCGYLFLTHHTFHSYLKMGKMEIDNSSANYYARFAGCILKYSRDGAALLEEDGDQLWNQAYQMSSPVADINGDSLILADQGGNLIETFDKTGEDGSILTGLPIEKAVVSEQGIVAAILSGDDASTVICYDAVGNVLARDDVTVSKSGYPIGISLSDDGTILLVTYLLLEDRGLSTRIAYYDFSDSASGQSDKLAFERVVEDDVFPEAFYMKDGVSAVVGQTHLLLYGKGASPELLKEIELEKEICSVAHSDDYIALVLENTDSDEPYELRVYDAAGKIVGSSGFSGDYSRFTIDGGTVFLDAGTSCRIFSVKGVCIYDGSLEENSSAILPATGIFRYALMCDDGIQMIQLIK